MRMVEGAIEGATKNINDAHMLFDFSKGNNEDLNAEIESRIDEPIDNELFEALKKNYASIKLNEPLIKRADDIIDYVTSINADGIKESSEAINCLRKEIDNVQSELRLNMESEEGKTLEFERDHIRGFNEAMREMYETETYRVYTGSGIDRHFNGFAPTKTYNLVGIPGGGPIVTHRSSGRDGVRADG